MRAPSTSRWRIAPQACLALLMLAHGAQAAPASKASLRAYFDAAGMAAQMSASMDAIAQYTENQWLADSDPPTEAQKKAVRADFNARVRPRMAWSRVEPLAIAIYRARLSETEVKALGAHARSAAGRLRYRTLKPALLRQTPVVYQSMLAVVHEVIGKQAAETETETETETATATATAPAGPEYALLLTCLRTLPGEKEDLDEWLAAMERLLPLSINSDGDGDGDGGAALRTRARAEMRTRLSFENMNMLKARLLSGLLTAQEIALLIDDNRRHQAQLGKAHQAERRLQQVLMRAMPAR
jgi:hypothetical protein